MQTNGGTGYGNYLKLNPIGYRPNYMTAESLHDTKTLFNALYKPLFFVIQFFTPGVKYYSTFKL